MPELILEILSEEIPARMQARAAADLERLVNDALIGAGFLPEGVKAFATPQRLALVAAGLPLRQPDRKEEKKGPRVGAPEKAIEGFLKSAGLSSLDQCAVREDKKGAYYVAEIDARGRETAGVLAEAIPAILGAFPWPKSMRWGEGELRWVRPIRSILCCFGGEPVPFRLEGIEAGDLTRGHRFMAGDDIRVRTFEKYAAALKGAKVILDGAERRALIAGDAKTLCEAQGLELVADDALLAEVAGLAEWPVVMLGAFDPKFLALPEEVLIAVMRGHQKYFSVRDPGTGRLAAKFVFVANLAAPDGGAAMRKGYERVLTARLSDASYLYRRDLAEWSTRGAIDEFVKPLERITFFEGLGTVAAKARRVAALAKEIAPLVGADPQLAEEAALLAKADLTTGMVYEFPELQGVMGRYYLMARVLRDAPLRGAPQDEGGVRAVPDAVRDHYRPKGADDETPTDRLTVAVGLADRLVSLFAFWRIGEKPSGSSDPFALRRAALGAIRILIANGIRLPLAGGVSRAAFAAAPGAIAAGEEDRVLSSLVAFFHDRLKVHLRDASHEGGGRRHDRIDAVLTKADGSLEDDLVLIVARLDALDAFLATDDGANLAAAYKRAANLLKAEQKKSAEGAPPRPAIHSELLKAIEEATLFRVLIKAEAAAEKAVAAEKFEEAMAALASLRAPIDEFFEKVTVNDADPALRANRLALLERFRAATATVADLSKLEG